MWAWVTAIGEFFSAIMRSQLGAWIIAALVWLGLSITTYTFGVDAFKSLIASEFSRADFLVDWIGFFGIDQAVTIVLSAIAAKYATQGAKIALTKKG